ncbi:MAG: molybdenum cofactor guanylyltransferase [Devosia sp.]
MSIATVILAGGQGSRLGGVDKASLILGGETLLTRAWSRLSHQCPVLVAMGSASTRRHSMPPDLIAVADRAGDSGPLAGLFAAAFWLSTHQPDCNLLQCVPVDSPFHPRDLTTTLAGALPIASAAIFPRYRGQVAWAHGLWRVDALLATLPALSTPLPGPRGLASRLGAIELDWPSDDGIDPFAGINTLRELLAAAREFAHRNNPQEVKTGLGKADQTG